MNFAYSDDQRTIESVMDRVFQDLDSVSMTRRAYSGNPLSRIETGEVAHVLAEQGLLGAFIADEHGGSGLELLDVVRVVSRSGARLLPFPLAASLAVLFSLGRFGSAEQKARWLPGIAGGDLIPTLAFDALLRPAVARAAAGGYRLSAEGLPVPHPDTTDLVVVPARLSEGGGAGLFILDRADAAVAVAPVWDLAEPAGRLTLEETTVPAERFVAVSDEGFSDLVALVRILVSADLYGVMDETLGRTVEYLKTRRQFGGPIGRFQALKHTAAADHVRIVNTELALRYAALAWSDRHPARGFYASLVKAYAAEHGITVTEDGVHLHGGMGFTWDADLHLFLKRAWRLSAVAGGAGRCRAEMAAFAFEPDGGVKTRAMELLA